MGAERVRARRGSGSIRVRNGRLLSQVSLGTDPSGRRIRRAKSFDSRTQAEAWIATQQLEQSQLTNPVTEDRVADYLRWWLAVEAPKGKPGRRPLARTTLAHYQVVIERHLMNRTGFPGGSGVPWVRWSRVVGFSCCGAAGVPSFELDGGEHAER
jgi:hypothetical protein